MKRLALLLVVVLLVCAGFAAYGVAGRKSFANSNAVAPPPAPPAPPIAMAPAAPPDANGLTAAPSSLGLLEGGIAEYDRTIRSPLAVGDVVRMSAELSNPYIDPRGPSELYMEILLNAKDAPSMPRRLPLNVTFVIDKSGSMAENGKLNYVKQAVQHFVRQLGPDDVVALVAFDTTARVILPAGPARNQAAILEAIASIHSGGSTAMCDGLQLGYSQARRYADREHVTRIMLLSDGLANVGVSDPRELRRMVSDYFEHGVSLSAIGVGEDFSETMMSGLAQAASGNYWFIGSPAEIPTVYAKEFENLRATVAKNITIRVDTFNGFDVQEVFGYEHRPTPTGVAIPLANLASGEKRSIVLRLRAPQGDPGQSRAANIALTYEDQLHDMRPMAFTQALAVERTNDAAKIAAGEQRRIAERVVLLRGAAAFSENARLLNEGKRDEARRLLAQTTEELRTRNLSLKSESVSKQIHYYERNAIDDRTVSLMPAPAAGAAARKQSLSRHAYDNAMVK